MRLPIIIALALLSFAEPAFALDPSFFGTKFCCMQPTAGQRHYAERHRRHHYVPPDPRSPLKAPSVAR